MPESTTLRPNVPTRLLRVAVVRLDARKHPAKVTAIDEELRRRAVERRAA